MVKQMLNKDIFTKIIVSCQKLDKVIKNQEKIFECNMEDGPLLNAWETLMNLLVAECEVVIDDEVGPIIYEFALCNNWGNDPKSYYIEGKEYLVYDAESLWDYLNEKLQYDVTHFKKEESCNETHSCC